LVELILIINFYKNFNDMEKQAQPKKRKLQSVGWKINKIKVLKEKGKVNIVSFYFAKFNF